MNNLALIIMLIEYYNDKVEWHSVTGAYCGSLQLVYYERKLCFPRKIIARGNSFVSYIMLIFVQCSECNYVTAVISVHNRVFHL